MEIILTALRRVSPCWRCLTGSMVAGSCTACGAEPPDPMPESIMETLESDRQRGRNPSTSYKGVTVRL